MMLALRFDGLRRILCLGAHADDIEIGCGGTLLRLLAGDPSIQVHWVVFSAEGPRGKEAELSARRFLADARVKKVVTHSYPDRFFPAEYAHLKREFFRLARDADPDLVFTHCLEDRHQDHRLLAELTWNTFREHAILEYEIPKYEADLGHPNIFSPLDQTTCQRKIDALLRGFPSQLDKPWFSEETFWSLLRLRGLEAGASEGLAEAFHGRKLRIEPSGRPRAGTGSH